MKGKNKSKNNKFFLIILNLSYVLLLFKTFVVKRHTSSGHKNKHFSAIKTNLIIYYLFLFEIRNFNLFL